MSTDVAYELFIGGRWVGSTGEELLDVTNPATEDVIARVPQGTVDDIDRAVRAAREAFDAGPWPRMTPAERAVVMREMFDVMNRRRAEIVDLNIAEAGSVRPLAEMLQVGIPLDHFRDTADRVLPSFAFEEAMLPSFGRGIGQGVVVREPFGVAALITAYNFPFFLNLFKVGPALAAGCTVVLKPSPYTPLEAFILGEIVAEVGLPPGVLNVVTGDMAAGEALTRHPMVDIVSFTGSDVVGRKVYAQSADTLKKVVLELGGKSANIICDDADLDKVVPDVLQGMLTHAGQGCSMLTRTLVHHSLHDELVNRVKVALDYLKIGNPADPEVTLGPLISAAQRDKVERLIAAGVDQGAQIAYGGGRPVGLDKGYFVEPTLFVNVDNAMTIARKEFFGPVGVVIAFRDDEEAVRVANDSEYGLGGGVWARDPARAYGLARRLRTGYVNINGGGGTLSPHGPFGGYKQSGLGREWGAHGLSEFLQHKTIAWGIA